MESEHSRIDASIETRMALALKQLFEQQRTQVTSPPEVDISLDLDNPDLGTVVPDSSDAR